MNGIFGMNATFTEERLVSMTLVNGKTVHRCMTIATSLQEALQRAKGEGKAYAYECSDIGAFQALVESTLQRKESVGRLVNQAMRDGTLQENPALE